MTSTGALRFASYAYPPNELGYCGPAGADDLLDGAPAEIERRARQFEGAWVYLEVLARALGTDDPLADEVVEAYWVGSDLLDAVDPADLLERLARRFGPQPGGTWRAAASRARAHHSFQVFEVYPWAAMLRAGLPPGPAVQVLDRCRIRTGRVHALDPHERDWVEVETTPLAWDGVGLAPGPRVTERVRWAVDGRSLMGAPALDELVALHWDWVCEVLTPQQAGRVDTLEAAQRECLGLVPRPATQPA